MKSFRNGQRVVGLLSCLMLGFQLAAGQQGTPGNPDAHQLSPADAARMTYKGRSLSIEEAAKLESKLANNPTDLETRFTLIGYYSAQRDAAFRPKKREQALWLIQNMPDSELLR